MQIVLRNQHPTHLRITGVDDAHLALSPLERRLLDSAELSPFDLDTLIAKHSISVTPVPQAEKLDFLPGLAGGLMMAFFIFFSIITEDSPWLREALVPWIFFVGPLVILIILAGVALVLRVEKKRIYAWSVQAVSLFVILLIGIGLPAMATNQFLVIPKLVSPEGIGVEDLGRFLQFLFIVVVSLYPALLFYTFDRRQLSTLRERFYRDVFRLDPNVSTLHDVSVKYGEQIEEIFGPELPSTSGTLARGTRWPILLATLMITLGWILTLPPQIASPVAPAGADGRAAIDLLRLFVPQSSLVVFGFVGAYFFTINMILRRYMRRDLKPKAYSHISVRILVVIILAWVLSLVPLGQPWLLATAFLAGIVPDTFLTFIQETVRRQLTKDGSSERTWFVSLREKHPLTNLDGIDLYDRARLLDEGVANIESLAHHDFIDLVLETRIPVPRLVDWVDQAILYLHLVPQEAAVAADTQLTRARLHSYGIRTATDLETVIEKARDRCGKKCGDQSILLAVLGGDENQDSAQSAKAPPRLRIVLDALNGDDWLPNIRHWRASNASEQDMVEVLAPVHTQPQTVGEQVQTPDREVPDEGRSE